MENKFYLGDRLQIMKDNIQDNSIHLIITSPPYNLQKNYENNSDSLPYDEYLSFLYETWKECKRVLISGGRICINIPSITYKEPGQKKGKFKFLYSHVINQMEELGFIPRGEIIWNKQNISKRTSWGSWKSPSNPYLVQSYEFILIFSKDEMKLISNEESDMTSEEFILWTNSLWNIKPETSKQIRNIHPSPFPEELVYRLMKFYSFPKQIVMDPFGGTGTIPVVAIKSNRNFVYIDNSTQYFDFAKNRIKEVKNEG